MSIETEIKKLSAGQTQLTDAIVHLTGVLEAYVVSQATTVAGTDNKKVPVSSANSEPPAPAPTGPAAVETKSEHNLVVYTMQQVNEILGSTAAQMGDNGNAVRAIMQEYGAQVINQVPQDKYAEVVAKVNALSGAPS